MQIKKVLNKVIVVLLTFTVGLFYALPIDRPGGGSTPQTPPPEGVPGNGGAGGDGPGDRLPTPIDMYEGILLAVAVLLIVGYYLYSRNRRVQNS